MNKNYKDGIIRGAAVTAFGLVAGGCIGLIGTASCAVSVGETIVNALHCAAGGGALGALAGLIGWDNGLVRYSDFDEDTFDSDGLDEYQSGQRLGFVAMMAFTVVAAAIAETFGDENKGSALYQPSLDTESTEVKSTALPAHLYRCNMA